MSNQNVIIADLDRDLRSALRVQLDAIGFTCFVVMDAREALEQAARQAPRMVMLDTGLPQFGAFEACARIRRLPDCKLIPIVLVTLLDRRQVRAAAARAGATRVLVKPFSVNDLLRELEPLMTDPDGRTPWRQSAGDVIRRSSGVAEPARNIWTPPRKAGPSSPQPAPLAQGLQMLDVMRRREAKREQP